MRAYLLILCLYPLFLSASPLDELRGCLDGIPQAADSMAERQRCFEMAKPIMSSPSLRARSLYLRALDASMHPDGTPEWYQAAGEMLAKYYREKVEPALNHRSLAERATKALQDALRAAHGALYYYSTAYNQEVGVEPSERIFVELERRKAATSEDARVLLELYRVTSEWKKAGKLAERWSGLGTLPTAVTQSQIEDGGLGYYTLSKDQKELVLERADVSSGRRIVMGGDCHFAVDAIRDLAAQPDIVDAMGRYGIVLADANFFEFAELDSLRRQFPAFELHPRHKTGSWFRRGFDVIHMPSWAFLSDGIVKFRFNGYDKDTVANFRAGLKAIGL